MYGGLSVGHHDVPIHFRTSSSRRSSRCIRWGRKRDALCVGDHRIQNKNRTTRHIPRTVSLRHPWRSWSQGRPASLCCQRRGVWNGKNGKSNEHLTLPEANMRHSGESSRTLAGSLRILKNIPNTNYAAACSCVRIIMACLINILSSYASSPM